MSIALAQAAWFMLPVFIGGLIHVAVIKLDWLAAPGRWPLDFNATVAGRRLFGDNKTVRGALVMIGATTLAAAGLAQALPTLSRQWAVSHWQFDHPLLWGSLLGAGYILGELPNSALKRQLQINPGASGRGVCAPLFWLLDQLDSAAGAFLLLSVLWFPTVALVAAVAALTLVLHPAVAGLMMTLGLKRRLG